MPIKSSPISYRREGLPCVMLVMVALIELTWCVNYHYEHCWYRAMLLVPGPSSNAGEGLVIQRNGLGYYAWLRSALIDHDWSFDNEFDEHNPHDHYVPPHTYRTPLDRRANQWSVGPALAWTPAITITHILLLTLNGHESSWASNGYSLPYQLAVGGTSLVFSLLGLGLIYGICLSYARPTRAALATTLLTLGTTLFYYRSIEISLPHGLGATAIAGLIWYWLNTYSSLRPGRWFLVGVLLGAACLVRWQLATFAILPTGEAAAVLLHSWGTRSGPSARMAFLGMACCLLGTVFAFLPQLIAWKCVYGSWLVAPIQGIQYHWVTLPFWDMLFSTDRSLFYWTPLALLGLMANLIGLGRAKPIKMTSEKVEASPSVAPQALLCIAFLMQVYALAVIWGQGKELTDTENASGVFLARSFGFRFLTDSLPALGPGMAWFLEKLRTKWLSGIALAGLLLVSWNFVLVALYINGYIPSDAGAGAIRLLVETRRMITEKPLILMLILNGPFFIGALLIRCLDPKPIMDGQMPHRPSR
jgi:hypothetical protein